ncbi:sugar ABC transporter permease [Paenibacillus sp. S3N08]|uniref:Sugar ABC transporter permease n=2 Tax=Paenibacillus agricola TaxID=2716264 RepID=A0ABX0JAN0_9BACL|nr:sugar ABC transporter permease [Paenibacillus agricola]
MPIMVSLYLAFTKYDILSPPEWVGFDNFKEMFTADPRYWKSVKATLIFVFVAVPLRLCFALVIAMLLNTKLRLLGFFRAAYYLPTLIGGSVAVAVMWRQLFGSEGAFNSFLAAVFGVAEKVSWITQPSTAMVTLILLSVWQFGSSMLIFLAGLKQVPHELYEASTVDGANGRQKFISITLPLLTPVIFFNLVMGVINGFKVFTEGLIVTGGGPLDTTLFYALYLYEKSFRYYEMGYGSAMAWVLLLTIGFLTAILFATSKKWVYYESKGD